MFFQLFFNKNRPRIDENITDDLINLRRFFSREGPKDLIKMILVCTNTLLKQTCHDFDDAQYYVLQDKTLVKLFMRQFLQTKKDITLTWHLLTSSKQSKFVFNSCCELCIFIKGQLISEWRFDFLNFLKNLSNSTFQNIYVNLCEKVQQSKDLWLSDYRWTE